MTNSKIGDQAKSNDQRLGMTRSYLLIFILKLISNSNAPPVLMVPSLLQRPAFDLERGKKTGFFVVLEYVLVQVSEVLSMNGAEMKICVSLFLLIPLLIERDTCINRRMWGIYLYIYI